MFHNEKSDTGPKFYMYQSYNKFDTNSSVYVKWYKIVEAWEIWTISDRNLAN